MAKYRGNGLVVLFINPGGTAVFATNHTAFDVARQIDLIDTTSGNDADKEYIPGNKSATATLKYLDDAVQAANQGTMLAAQVIEGTYGTVTFGPQGTVTGKPKGSFAAYVKSHKFVEPFDKAVDIEVQFEKTGPMLADYGAIF